jgi:hypothetical protein
MPCHRLRRMTRLAGRLTPAASVEVAVSTCTGSKGGVRVSGWQRTRLAQRRRAQGVQQEHERRRARSGPAAVARTISCPCLKPFSTTLRSWLVRPAWWYATPATAQEGRPAVQARVRAHGSQRRSGGGPAEQQGRGRGRRGAAEHQGVRRGAPRTDEPLQLLVAEAAQQLHQLRNQAGARARHLLGRLAREEGQLLAQQAGAALAGAAAGAEDEHGAVLACGTEGMQKQKLLGGQLGRAVA